MREPLLLGGTIVGPGTRKTVDIPISVLSDHTPVSMSVHAVHGRRPGPTVFVSAVIHGDEVIGVEIVRRLLKTPSLDRLKGTLLAIPIVNTYGFINHSRYLPDRRDLNRCFPGSPKGSLAGRLARIMMDEVVSRSDVGIDLHSAATHRVNLPQIRVSPGSRRRMDLATSFAPPLILTSPIREGSLRHAAEDAGVDMLLYEAGEGLRFDEFSVRAGVTGILRVLHSLGMIARKGVRKAKAAPLKSRASYWLRAPAGGLLRPFKSEGDDVAEGDVLGAIADPFGQVEDEIIATDPGLIIGRSIMPVVNEGDGIFHIAKIAKSADPEATLDTMTSQLDADPLFDEDEII